MAISAAVPGLKPSAALVLDLLRERPAGLTSLEALHDGAGLRLSGRILELRQAGYAIESIWETTDRGARVARYVLIPDADGPQLRMAFA